MVIGRCAKGYYTEAEAARELALSIDDFRALVRRHILDTEEDAANLPMTTYQPSDLLLLRLLVSGQAAPTTAG